MKKPSGNTWLEKNKDDEFYKKAKRENYRARSIYKLQELNEKFNILKIKGKTVSSVLDVGCAPGSWLQWLNQKIGPSFESANENEEQIKDEIKTRKKSKRMLVGIDLTTIRPIEGVEFHRGSIEDEKFVKSIIELYPKGFDVILSDAAPKTMGNKNTDNARQIGLAEQVISLAGKMLKPGGNCLIKLFEGSDSQEFIQEYAPLFSFSKLSKPKASRRESKETYFVAKGFKGFIEEKNE